MVVDVLYLAKCDRREAAVPAWVRSPGWASCAPALFLVLLPICGLLVPQPVRLARLAVPGLDETRQETQSPETSFERHCRVRIQPFRLGCKRAPSRDFFQPDTTTIKMHRFSAETASEVLEWLGSKLPPQSTSYIHPCQDCLQRSASDCQRLIRYQIAGTRLITRVYIANFQSVGYMDPRTDQPP